MICGRVVGVFVDMEFCSSSSYSPSSSARFFLTDIKFLFSVPKPDDTLAVLTIDPGKVRKDWS